MIIFSKEKYISTVADVFQIVSPTDMGYFLVSKEVYDHLILLKQRGKYNPEKMPYKRNKKEIKYFMENVPTPLEYLTPILELMTFGLEEDMELLTGICSVISMTNGLGILEDLNSPQYKDREYSPLLLNEYKIPRQIFLSSCVPYEEMIDPDNLANKHIFLNVYGGSSGQLLNPNQQSTSAPVQEEPEDDPEDYRYYIKRNRAYDYWGSGQFSDKATGGFITIVPYNEKELMKVFGLDIKVTDPFATDDDEVTEETVVASGDTPVAMLPEAGNLDTAREVASFFSANLSGGDKK